ncbi:TolC family protein [Caminibacter sp.]
MKKLKLFFSLVPVFAFSYQIGDLFEAVKKIPDSKIDNLNVKQIKIAKKEVSSKYKPSVTFNASIEHFNTYMSLKPLPPTEATALIKQNKSLPFGQNIEKIGLVFSMPLFVKSLNDTSKKMKYLIKAKSYAAKINLLKREALLVNALSNLNYLNSLILALKKKKSSISRTLKAIKAGVKNGAVPEFKALKLKDALNQINIAIQNVKIQKANIKKIIYTLTKLDVDKISFKAVKNVKNGEFISLKPLKEQIFASKKDIEIAKDSFYPEFLLKATAFRNFTKAYNTKENMAVNIASIGVYLKWDILNFSNSKKIQKAKINYQKSVFEFEKAKKDLISEVKEIDSSLKNVNKALADEINSIGLKEELLKSAKVAFELNEMSVNDYLSYEDDLYKARADLAKLKALKNSLIAKKALIYGINLERIFK